MIFLGLGTNQGNKEANLLKAISLLDEQSVHPIRISSFYLTPPWGIIDQDEFLNAVVEVSYLEDPQKLLKIILEVENTMGRVRKYKWGPRLIDIDILEFNRQKLALPNLQIPHPLYPQRVFVLKPLVELEPDWIPTGYTQTAQDLLATISKNN